MTSLGEENWQKIQRDLGVVLKNWDFQNRENIPLCPYSGMVVGV